MFGGSSDAARFFKRVPQEARVYMDKVCDDRATMVVKRARSRSVVLLSEDEYEGLLMPFAY